MEEENNSTEEQKPLSELEKAKAERMLMEKATNELREENNRMEELKVKETLGGTADAGSSETKKEETDHEYRQRVEQELAGGKYD